MTLYHDGKTHIVTLEILVPITSEEVLLTCELDVHDELAEALVHLVDGYRVVLVPLLPVAHDNEGHAHVDAR